MSYWEEDCYNCEHNNGLVFLIIVGIILFPLLPYMVVGYEIGKFINNINAVKWGCSVLLTYGVIHLILFNFKNIKNLYKILFFYLTTIPFMFLLFNFFPKNEGVIKFTTFFKNFYNYIINWLVSS